MYVTEPGIGGLYLIDMAVGTQSAYYNERKIKSALYNPNSKANKKERQKLGIPDPIPVYKNKGKKNKKKGKK